MLRVIWLTACGRNENFNADNGVVCSVHFTDDDFKEDLKCRLRESPIRKRALKDHAVPSLFLSSDECELPDLPVLVSQNDVNVPTCETSDQVPVIPSQNDVNVPTCVNSDKVPAILRQNHVIVPTGVNNVNVPTGVNNVNVPTGVNNVNVPTGVNDVNVPTDENKFECLYNKSINKDEEHGGSTYDDRKLAVELYITSACFKDIDVLPEENEYVSDENVNERDSLSVGAGTAAGVAAIEVATRMADYRLLSSCGAAGGGRVIK
ncbi:hypothetical protein Pmani_014429 [Petrolisthes manimaculis]|uniref:THAP-type domain-containing protein n=1 Tax=Petrolisthes manimaculis TaxID=1843537 RepID=A0AAE1PW83_9EUCA|nr:hypothetical protein Pmani_014429 [Petrolisthes manimaculis]